MRTAAHVAANILAIGALSVAAGSAQKSDGGTTAGSGTAEAAPVSSRAAGASPVAPVRPSLAARASRSENRWLPPTTTTTSASTVKAPAAQTHRSTTTAVNVSSASPATAPDRSRIRACIIRNESGGDPLAHNAHSSAAGIGQWLTPTWNNWGGYATADLAPMDVQQQRMDYDMSLPMAHIQAEWAAQRKACGF